ncbi:ImmA/IrrE family metallo-endopeptidase [Clostridium sp. WILCCON 0269]|uniref:ImmA/IrrE family metallo-endopeptidase n=1 Tax=Candidatus Clostridium eludens TaxID=3381663 RepID=A0ABW8SLR0_9CLOT
MINFRVRVRNLVRKYDTRNPYNLAKELGFHIIEEYLSVDAPKGLFKKILGKKFIVINLTRIENEYEKKFTIAHELGHAIFHSSNNTFFLHDHTFYQRGRFENDANKFAAELLIDETGIDKCYLENMSTDQLACYCGVPKQLIEYKFNK